ncbi:uncharacterized protein ASPGLDRAFT_134595 [Aspergillus glaucus CBS 516.65]|uniref:Uncharacterized protein n=1 Tax=Aspergillus glaucus CBS 516.65 TaxID=1160497 RepID=A0A1L9V9A2_ASPGL|nr:hypothetical protein ASPGLDRAFT_134595 [Aspergillus glaucus CBS 516.65]OJJ80508.1 hypothetical protein ASPGLDRAFT_134595 [Aspergillus glaucus CBS 516.65]
MSNPQLLDIEPGGENTQYESTHTFVEPPEKQTGQLGAGEKHTKSQMKTTFGSGGHKDEDLKMAHQLETGEPGGGLRGETDKDLKPENQAQEGNDRVAAKTRSQQRYGPGSGIGA